MLSRNLMRKYGDKLWHDQRCVFRLLFLFGLLLALTIVASGAGMLVRSSRELEITANRMRGLNDSLYQVLLLRSSLNSFRRLALLTEGRSAEERARNTRDLEVIVEKRLKELRDSEKIAPLTRSLVQSAAGLGSTFAVMIPLHVDRPSAFDASPLVDAF